MRDRVEDIMGEDRILGVKQVCLINLRLLDGSCCQRFELRGC
jgi:hypothetical protein